MPRGRRPFPWIKLWFDMLNDVKMNRLSIAERGCWTGILLLAGQSPERGKLLLTETEPMTIDDIASALHLTPEERPALESCISKLVTLNSLRRNEHNCLEVINFKKRQGPPQYIGETEAKITQHEKPIKQMLIQRLWGNNWQPTGEEILLVESEKRIGNLYMDIVAETVNNTCILIEVKPFSLQPAHLGQVKRYLAALRDQTDNQVTAFLVGRDRKNITEEDEKSSGISVLTFDAIGVSPTVTPTVSPTLNQPYIEEEGRGEKKDEEEDVTPLPSGKGAHKKRVEAFVTEIFNEMRTYLGYPDRVKEDPIPSYGKEGQAIKRMLTRGFTREEVTDCWKQKVDARGGEFVSMTWVNEDIGKKEGKGEQGKGRRVKVRPREAFRDGKW